MVEPLILIAGAAAAYFFTKKEEPLPEEPPLPVELPTVALPTVAVEPAAPTTPPGACVRIHPLSDAEARNLASEVDIPSGVTVRMEVLIAQVKADHTLEMRSQYEKKGWNVHVNVYTRDVFACPAGEAPPPGTQPWVTPPPLVQVGGPRVDAYIRQLEQIREELERAVSGESSFARIRSWSAASETARAAAQVVLNMANKDVEAGLITKGDFVLTIRKKFGELIPAVPIYYT